MNKSIKDIEQDVIKGKIADNLRDTRNAVILMSGVMAKNYEQINMDSSVVYLLAASSMIYGGGQFISRFVEIRKKGKDLEGKISDGLRGLYLQKEISRFLGSFNNGMMLGVGGGLLFNSFFSGRPLDLFLGGLSGAYGIYSARRSSEKSQGINSVEQRVLVQIINKKERE